MLTNQILGGLPHAEFERVRPLLEPLLLDAGERLSGAGEAPPYVYFPEGSVLAYRAELRGGAAPEVGMVGREGVACLSPLLGPRPAPQSLEVLAGGPALRMRAADFERELGRAGALRTSVLAYAGDYLAQVSQRAACLARHKARQRLAVWLLLLAERLDSDAFNLTQERIARHLGLRRAGVNVLADQLQEAGVISHSPGRLRLLDRPALEAAACECYAAVSAHGRAA